VLLDFNALFWKMWRLGGHQDYVEFENAIKGQKMLQLLKAYDKVQVPPTTAVGIWRLFGTIFVQ
jgi:hypothetical protein